MDHSSEKHIYYTDQIYWLSHRIIDLVQMALDLEQRVELNRRQIWMGSTYQLAFDGMRNTNRCCFSSFLRA